MSLFEYEGFYSRIQQYITIIYFHTLPTDWLDVGKTNSMKFIFADRHNYFKLNIMYWKNKHHVI